MIRSLTLLAAVALLAGPARGQDGEAHAIKIKKAAEGDTLRVEIAEQGTEYVKVADLKGKLLGNQDKTTVEATVYTETIVAKKPGERPTRLKRKYDKAEQTLNDEKTTFPYQGKTVLIEKKGGKYVFRIEGGDELTGDDAKLLNEEFNGKKQRLDEALEKLLLPTQPVKVGETWKLDPAALARALQEGVGLGLHSDKTVATGKLTRVYKKDGRLFGVIAVAMKLAPKSITEDGKTMKVEAGGRLVVELGLDACIDGSIPAGTATFSVTLNAQILDPSPEQPTARITVTSRQTGKHTEAPQ